MRLFEALFKGVSTRFGLRTIESPFENQELIFCSFFQNLRLGSIIFEALFKVVSTQFGPLSMEKSIENPHFILPVHVFEARL